MGTIARFNMPTVDLQRDDLFARLGWSDKFTAKELGDGTADDAFQALCFEYGIELDEVTSEKEMAQKERGDAAAADCSDNAIYKIDCPANRPDLLCMEGIARTLMVYQGTMEYPVYNVVVPANPITMTVHPETAQIRPHVVCAVLRGVKFDPVRCKGFIDLQTKLHLNICRRRTLVAIGTHDMSNIKPPFTYQARKPEDICFAPLTSAARPYKKEDGHGVMATLAKDRELSKYLDIIEDSPVYPVIYDSTEEVMSMPPIINGEHSKISVNTTDIFIECTATDLYRAKIVVNTMCAMYAEYCSTPFEIEAVKVINADGSTFMSPEMGYQGMEVEPGYVNRAVGITIDPTEMCATLEKMMMPAKYNEQSKKIEVQIPCTRSDVMHQCDIMEDIAIAYGYDNIERVMPKVCTVGKKLPLNSCSDHIRRTMAMAGYNEILTFGLIAIEENFDFMRPKDEKNLAVRINKPRVRDVEIVRTHLIPGLLKTIQSNLAHAPPYKLFEVSDICELDDTQDVGARNVRRLALLHCGQESGFQYIHGMVDQLMAFHRIKHVREAGAEEGYCLREGQHPSFFTGGDGICAEVVVKGKVIGRCGILHPDVLSNFAITLPCSAMEIDVAPFVYA